MSVKLLPLLALVLSASAWGDGLPPLPNPLSLSQALSLIPKDHPAMGDAMADQAAARADDLQARSRTGLRLTLEGRLRVVEPVDISTDRSRNDSSAILSLSKRLYDWGATGALREAAAQRGKGAEWAYLSSRQQQHLLVMRRFFDVLLADLTYARENEGMATAFVAVDKARDRRKLGSESDIEVLRLESLYQSVRQRRFAAASAQRSSRSLLAVALARPRDLPADLLRPVSPDLKRMKPELEALMTEVLAGNPRLRRLRALRQAAEARVDAARKRYGPVLYGEVRGGVYARETGSSHPVGGGLLLEVPLLSGGERDAAIAQADAERQRVEARLQAAELELRHLTTELWLAVDEAVAEVEAAKAQAAYRELYLDRSRALYSLEVKTDLGDSMVQTSAARLRVAKAEFNLHYLWARLDALRGRLVSRADKPTRGAKQ